MTRSRQHVSLRPPAQPTTSLVRVERQERTAYGALLPPPQTGPARPARSPGSLPLPDAVALTALLGLASLAASGWVDAALPWAR